MVSIWQKPWMSTRGTGDSLSFHCAPEVLRGWLINQRCPCPTSRHWLRKSRVPGLGGQTFTQLPAGSHAADSLQIILWERRGALKGKFGKGRGTLKKQNQNGLFLLVAEKTPEFRLGYRGYSSVVEHLTADWGTTATTTFFFFNF